MTNKYSFPTTTLIVDKTEIDFERLQSHYRLIRYVLPYDWANRGRGLYSRLYVQLREQLEVPYVVFQHDKIDSSKKRVIYALYDVKNTSIAQLNFDFLSDTENPLPYSEIQFQQVELHIAIKLLQSAFANFYPYFASMGKYYIHVDTESEGWELCMEIALRGALENQDNDGHDRPIQEFQIMGHSRYFKQLQKDSKEISEDTKQYKVYYKKSYDKSGFVVFKQLTTDEIETHIGALFYLYSNPANKPHIDYHNQSGSKIEPCRGYALHRFIEKFMSWLTDKGVPVKQKIRNWEKPKLKVENSGKEINVKHLDNIFLYDARWNKNDNSLLQYQQLLQQMFSEVDWNILNDLSESNNQPTLILQDADATDYATGEHLEGKVDPYPTIKRNYCQTPTQFINVNPNKPKDKADQQSYLSYPVIELQKISDEKEPKDTDWGRKFRVAILQLYMKNIVLNNLSASQYLPLSGILEHLTHYGYVRKRSYQDGDTNASIGYRAFLQFEGDRLMFSNLSTPDNRKTLEEMCRKFGYDWYDIEDVLIERRYKQDKDEKEEKDVSLYDLVLMEGLVILIDELDETVLYKYDKIKQRLEGRTVKREIEELLLRDHYNTIKPADATLTKETLEDYGYPLDPASNTPSIVKSSDFLVALDKYDEWLMTEVKPANPKISIEDLRSKYEDKIAEIFGWDERDPSKKTTLLLDYYKMIFDLGAATGVDVQLSQGIYFDKKDYAYRVGGVYGLNKGSQDRANRIRRFEAIYGDLSHFDPKPLLEAMSVQFVRYNRYTVHPFPFYLLDMYINDVIRAN
jgi:hypothetical protein